MKIPDCLNRFGLRVDATELTEVRSLLKAETHLEKQRQGDGDTELMKLLSVQLFGTGQLEDVFLIWAAKTASMDADASIDVQLLCGAGLDATKAFLRDSFAPEAETILKRITNCEKSGDFIDFTPEALMKDYEDYFTK